MKMFNYHICMADFLFQVQGCSHAFGTAHLHSHLRCAAQTNRGDYSSKYCSWRGSGLALPLSHYQGWLSRAFTIRASSAVLLRHGLGPNLPSVRGRDSSPTLMTSELALPITAGDEGQGSRRHHHCRHFRASSPMFLPLRLPYECHIYQGQPYCASQARCRACSPNSLTAVISEGKG